jgi:hypothetical protein
VVLHSLYTHCTPTAHPLHTHCRDVHCDKAEISSWDYSALLYLNSGGGHFRGGDFAFIDADADRVITPSAGRLGEMMRLVMRDVDVVLLLRAAVHSECRHCCH